MPDTFHGLLIVVTLFNVVFPDTFNADTYVEGSLKLIMVGGLDRYCIII